MLAMALYTPNFNLMSQQDAEEALAHMLSSFREECSVSFSSNHNSLAIATGASNRILASKKRVIYSELERWTQSFIGPFNGIIGSNFTCQTCGWDSFHCKGCSYENERSRRSIDDRTLQDWTFLKKKNKMVNEKADGIWNELQNEQASSTCSATEICLEKLLRIPGHKRTFYFNKTGVVFHRYLINEVWRDLLK